MSNKKETNKFMNWIAVWGLPTMAFCTLLLLMMIAEVSFGILTKPAEEKRLNELKNAIASLSPLECRGRRSGKQSPPSVLRKVDMYKVLKDERIIDKETKIIFDVYSECKPFV
ncbi:MAG: hypothetical protein COB67_00475 [SAR324 cluster bacterium]|uniref:Uncharacterized protein n=1 Tax=SAR324 cluster bacterium TaxID=2024889 RepID=A0A2A4TBR2_9DELT|nr:MAG: hypothetical protein COB67_00475 [SAR324 cluster bacterium]